MFSEGIKIPGKYFALSALASLALSACADIVPKENSQAQVKQEEIKVAFKQKGFQVTLLKDGLLVVGNSAQTRADILQILKESKHDVKIGAFPEDGICVGAVIPESKEIEPINLQKQLAQTQENAEKVLKEAGLMVQDGLADSLLITEESQKKIEAILECNGIVTDNFDILLIPGSGNLFLLSKKPKV